ncbi:MAG TPA: hypothetical protein VNO86_07745 [Candidatus Binatia bacterium]|nr:hypothetical protein [Candidatus Binatia bacterium]
MSDSVASPAQSEQAFYVWYRGKRLPLSAAGDYSCHDLARPEIRCFDTIDELRADLHAYFPSHAERFDSLLNGLFTDTDDR